MTFAVMMLCNTGTRSLCEYPLSWRDDQHVITVSAEPTEADAWREVARLQPRGFNRENAGFFVLPWAERHNPAHWPRRALPYFGRSV